MGKRYPQFHSWLRGIPLESYIIFYEVREDEITILRVVNGRQDLDALFDESDSSM